MVLPFSVWLSPVLLMVSITVLLLMISKTVPAVLFFSPVLTVIELKLAAAFCSFVSFLPEIDTYMQKIK